MKRIVFLLILIMSAGFLFGETVEIVTLDYPPYISESLSEMGPHAEIVKRSLELSGHTAQITLMTWSRAYALAETGKAFLITASNTEERRKIFHYSEAYDNNDTYLIGLKSNFSTDTPLAEIKSKKVSLLRGHFAVDLLSNMGFSKVIQVNDDESALRMVMTSRADLVVTGKNTFLTLLDKVGKNRDDFTLIEPPLNENTLHMIALKTMSGSEGIIKDFDRGLAELRSSGELETILKRHGID